MSGNVETRINDLAYDLAKKDTNYIEAEDKDNQEKLQTILFRSNMNKDTIRMKLEAIVNDLDRNPDYNVTNGTREDVLVVMEEHLRTGTLESIDQIKNEEFMTTAVIDRVMEYEVRYNNEVSSMLSSSYMKGEKLILTSYLVGKLIDGTLSQERLNQLENIFENSKPVIKKGANSVNKIINSTEEEKQSAARYMSDKEIGENTEYFKEHRDNKSARGALFLLARKATSGDQTLMQEACIKAAQFGLNDVIKEDGTIDLDLVYGKFKESVADDPDLASRYSSKEKFLEKIEQARERGKENSLRQYTKDEKFVEKWNKCKTDEEREDFFKTTKENRSREIETIKKIVKESKVGNVDKVKELIETLKDSDRHNIVDMVTGSIKNTKVSEEIGEFINETFGVAKEESKSFEEPDDGAR